MSESDTRKYECCLCRYQTTDLEKMEVLQNSGGRRFMIRCRKHHININDWSNEEIEWFKSRKQYGTIVLYIYQTNLSFRLGQAMIDNQPQCRKMIKC